MKIGIFSPYLDTPTGGEKYVLTAAACLSENNKVSVFWDFPEDIKKSEKVFGLDLSKVNVVKNIFSRKISLIQRLIQSRQYDVIMFLSDGSIPLLGCRLFVHFQHPVDWVKYDSLFSKFKIGRINKVICNSLFTKNYIDQQVGVKSVVLYPPVSDLGIGKEKKENTILTVGRYGPASGGTSFKKQEILIEAFKKMQKSGLKNWRFFIATSYKEENKAKVDELKKRSKGFDINFIENASWDKIVDINGKAKIYWHAAGYGEDLNLNPHMAEHFGISTVEAMSAGAVPIVYGAGGQKEIIEDKKNGYYWFTEKELMEKTSKVIENEELLIKMGKMAEERSRDFTGNRFCVELQKIFKE